MLRDATTESDQTAAGLPHVLARSMEEEEEEREEEVVVGVEEEG